MANMIYARVMQKTATLSEWMSSDLVLLDGEQAFVVSGDGTPINFKIGDGTKTFSELPFWIQYDQAQYISVESTSLPTPSQDVGYSLVGSGTYTKAGQSDVVVPSGHMGILNWDGSVWYLGSSVEMPEQVADGEIEEGDDRAVSGDKIYKQSILKSDITSTNIVDIESEVEDFYVNAQGEVSPSEGASYAEFRVDGGQDKVYMQFPFYEGSSNRRIAFLDSDRNVISVHVISPNVTEFTIPQGTVFMRFTVTQTNSPSVVDINDVIVNYTGEFEGGAYVYGIGGKPLKATYIENNEHVKEVVDSINKVKAKPIVTNLINPDEAQINKTVLIVGGYYQYSDSANYSSTGLIPVEYGGKYSFSNRDGSNNSVRSYRVIAEDGIVLKDVSSPSVHTNIEIDSPNATHVIAVFHNTTAPSDLCMREGYDKQFQEYSGEQGLEFVAEDYGGAYSDNALITKKYLEDFSLNSKGGSVINIANSDKLMFIGSSSVESFYTPDRKSWVNRLADMLDIMFVPYGWSGGNADTMADRLNSDTPTAVANGVKPSELKPTYVYIGQTLNSRDMLEEPTDEELIESNRNMLQSAVSRTGGYPILGTMYRTEQRPWIENSFKLLADEWNAHFMPMGTYTSSLIRNEKYAGFYGNGHPGIRTNESYTLYLWEYFKKLPRARKCVLVFEPRDEDSSISDLTYKNSDERAVKFRSIQVGEKALDVSDQNMYDRLNESYGITKTNTSDYMRLFRGQDTELSKKVLIEIIIDRLKPDSIEVNISGSNTGDLYLFNNLTKQWDSVNSLVSIKKEYVEYDKVKVLLASGVKVNINKIEAIVKGGHEKPSNFTRVLPPNGGEIVFDSNGFDDSTIQGWDLGGNVRYNQTVRYGSPFSDIPKYLGDNKDIVVLSGSIKKDVTIPNNYFGYRKIRVWVCARVNPKIYNPEEFVNWQGVDNPYTDIDWNNENNFDYEDLDVILRSQGVQYENQAKSINKVRVGLFWSLLYTDVIIPVGGGDTYEVLIDRGSNYTSHDVELCDVKIELLND